MAYSSSLDPDRDDHKKFAIDTMVESARKSALVAYLLWFFLGALGVHNFYLGKPGLACLQLAGTLIFLTADRMGGLIPWLAIPIGFVVLISLLIDMCLMPVRVRAYSELLRARLELQAG
jgi:TM2 domain-containing membrane protein YozV